MRRQAVEIADLDGGEPTLKARSLRGGMVTILFQGVDAFVRIASIAVLARALMPEDFGLVSMVTAVTAIAEQFKDIGLSTATVQKKRISHAELSQLFWVNIITGVAIAAFVSAAAVPIAGFFGDGRLVAITIAIASGFVWSGAMIQHQALLRRQMRYTAIGGIQIGATVISVGIAVVLAFQGYGFWALVWREVLRNVFIAIGTWLVCPWLPDLPRKNIDIDNLVRFGGHITGFNMIVFLTASIDQLLLGKVYGPAHLGMYRQAYQLMFWPVMQLTVPLSRVAEPTLSALQGARDRYRQAYEKLLTIMNAVMMPLSLFAAVYAQDIVTVVLGQKWIEATPIFRVLALATLLRPASDSTGLLLVTCGKTRRYLNLGVATGLVLVVAFSVGVVWGAVGVAYGILVATLVLLALRLKYSFEGTPVTAGAFCRALATPLLASGSMAAVLVAMNALVEPSSSVAALAVAAPVALGSYLLAWMLIPGGRAKLGQIVRDLSGSINLDARYEALKHVNWKRLRWSQE
jgi:O-antigen/teichoic acid export membrane protein